MHKPQTSIIIPLFNHEKYIASTIESALNQTHTDFELIIVNDGSTDASEEVVRTFTDKRIKYFYQDNKGAHAAINRGLDISTGDYISILNSDDRYHPERLERALSAFEDNSGLAAVFTNIDIRKNGVIIHVKEGCSDNWKDIDSEYTYKADHNTVLDLLAGNFLVTTSNLICRKDVIDQTGRFLGFRYAHDYDFFLRLGLQYPDRIKLINESLLTYRFHESNTILQNDRRVAFETNLVLAKALNSIEFQQFINHRKPTAEDILKFYNSIQTLSADRLLLSLLAVTREWSDIDYVNASHDNDSVLFESFKTVFAQDVFR